MMIARHYVMNAAPGKEGALKSVIACLAAKVRSLPGCEGVEVLQDLQSPTEFMFIELWISVNAHKEGAASLGRDAFTEVMAALDEPPKGRYMDYVPV